MKQIYILKFTRDDGATWKLGGEFFVSKRDAEAKAKRLNEDLPDLRRYEVETLTRSWDDTPED